MSDESKCPVSGDARKSTMAGTRTNADWWPNQLNLKPLHQHCPLSNPMGEDSITLRSSRASTWMP